MNLFVCAVWVSLWADRTKHSPHRFFDVRRELRDINMTVSTKMSFIFTVSWAVLIIPPQRIQSLSRGLAYLNTRNYEVYSYLLHRFFPRYLNPCLRCRQGSAR
jgi:hypothetical protein